MDTLHQVPIQKQPEATLAVDPKKIYSLAIHCQHCDALRFANQCLSGASR